MHCGVAIFDMNLTTILDVCQNAALVLKIGSWVDISHFELKTPVCITSLLSTLRI